MDKIYRRKLIKVAIATPLALSVALVLDIDPGLAFFGPLYVFNTIWLFPDPIGLKQFIMLKQLSLFLPVFLAAAFIAGLWGINSIVIFLFVLLVGWGIQVWVPSAISLGILPPEIYNATSVLNSSEPYTTAVYMWLLIAMAMGMGWLSERLFWPILDRQGIERQVRKTFRSFQVFCDRAFHPSDVSSDGGDGSLENLTAQADGSIRAANKALKTAGTTGSLAPPDREAWLQALALQGRLLAHLLAISGLLQENRENPLLQELAPELSALGDSLSATFAELSVAIVDQHPGIQLPSPHLDFQRWQNQLNSMRAAGTTQSYNLASRLAVGLIEHHLEGLVTDISKFLAWRSIRRSAVSADLPSALEPAR